MLFFPDSWGKVAIGGWVVLMIINVPRTLTRAETTAGLVGGLFGTVVGGILFVALIRYVYVLFIRWRRPSNTESPGE